MEQQETLVCKACFAPLKAERERSRIVTCEFCNTENLLPERVRKVSEMNSRESLSALRRAMVKALSAADFKDVVFYLQAKCPGLHVSIDEYGYPRVSDQIRELIKFCHRRMIMTELIESIREVDPRFELD